MAEGIQKFTLDRSPAGACRLNLQYYLWKEMLKYDIHPSIPLSRDSIIADVACGTGIWLIHVARELPNAQVDGFDIDLTLAPHELSLPPNTSLRNWNIFNDIPSDMVGKYDVVHVRLLILVVENSDPSRIIQKLLELLKPGGYLQWDELDFVNMIVNKEDSTVQAPALDGLYNLCRSDGKNDWSVKLPEFLSKEGFTDPTIDYFGDSRDIMRAFHDQHMLTLEEFATTAARKGQKEMAKKIYQLIEDAFHEATKGATLCIPRVVCTARKEN
ncbi:MAG: hypothetical protein Q9225_004219 [Loekoesia sp. 1 TL-2023]